MRLGLLGPRYEQQICNLLEQLNSLTQPQVDSLVTQLGQPDLSKIRTTIQQLGIDESRCAVMIRPIPINTSEPYIHLILLTAGSGKLVAFPKEELGAGRGLIFEFFGQIEEPDTSDDQLGPARWTVSGDPSQSLVPIKFWLMRAAAPGSPMVAQLQWKPTFGLQIRKTIEIEGDAWSRETLKKASPTAIRAMTFLHGAATRPGPTPGTAWNQKYRTPEHWHAAIRATVLTKRTVATAPDHQIAEDWLGISPATMYRLMGSWGPSTLEDLRNGKF